MEQPKKIRVVLIDAQAKEARAIEIEAITSEQYEEPSLLPAYYDLIGGGCDTVQPIYPEGMKGHVCYCDEDGWRNQHRYGVAMRGFDHQPICGNVIVIGYDEEGNDLDCTLDPKTVERNCFFVELEYQ